MVTSTFGAMFAPDQALAGAELLAGARPAAASAWPTGARRAGSGSSSPCRPAYRPPSAGVLPPTRWGTADGPRRALPGLWQVEVTEQYVDYVSPQPEALFELFEQWFGPVATVMATVGPERAAAFRADWIALADQHNTATDGTVEFPSCYLQVVATKR